MENYNELIRQSGLKKKYIAKHIGVTSGMFSSWLHNKKNLAPEKVIEMKLLLKQAKTLKNKIY